ncbi:MAG: V-type ATP synthase subunit I [Anaerovoracaceae bacterium]
MSIVRMKKVSVIGLDTIKDKLISELMDVGALEFTDMSVEALKDEGYVFAKDGNADQRSKLETRLNNTVAALATFEKYSNEKPPLFTTRRPMKVGEFQETVAKLEKIKNSVHEVLVLKDKIQRSQDEINRLNAELSSVTPWVNYDIPLQIEGTKRTRFTLGVIPVSVDIAKLIKKIEEHTGETHIVEVNRDKEMVYLVAITMKDLDEDVLIALKQKGFSPISFMHLKGTAIESTDYLKAQIKKKEDNVKSLIEEVRELMSIKPVLECYHDYLVMACDKEKAKERLLKTNRTFNLEGWVPVNCEEAVSNVLKQNDCIYEYSDPKPDEEVPVLTVNNGFVQPFEAITDMYSAPAYRGVDPTKYFAFFYVLFFGIMLSDAGYGIVMAIACFVVLKKFELEGMTHKMVKLFFFCGLSTVFFGAMFGGWFGDFFQVAAKTLFNKEITIEPLWFNPLQDPTRLLIYSLIIGVVHLFLGMGIKAGMLIKEGRLKDAVFDIFTWYLVIGGLALWLGGGMVATGLVPIGKWMTIVGAVVLVLTGGRDKKGVGKVIGGLGALYNITGYVSDILSYSRLLALGLATGVIAQVVNTMGSIAGGGVVGLIVMIVAFVVGHTFNLAINALGAFVHSSRLQYIEFFGKFYEDGGEDFAPFMKNTKYIRLISDKKMEVQK